MQCAFSVGFYFFVLNAEPSFMVFFCLLRVALYECYNVFEPFLQLNECKSVVAIFIQKKQGSFFVSITIISISFCVICVISHSKRELFQGNIKIVIYKAFRGRVHLLLLRCEFNEATFQHVLHMKNQIGKQNNRKYKEDIYKTTVSNSQR